MKLLWRLALLVTIAVTVCSTSSKFNPKRETFRHPTLGKTYCYKYCAKGKYKNGAKYCWEKCPAYMAFFEGWKARSDAVRTPELAVPPLPPSTSANVVSFYVVVTICVVFFVVSLIQGVVLYRRRPTTRRQWHFCAARNQEDRIPVEDDEVDTELDAVPEVLANDTRNSSTGCDRPRVIEIPD